jgi:hypothetical protein
MLRGTFTINLALTLWSFQTVLHIEHNNQEVVLFQYSQFTEYQLTFASLFPHYNSTTILLFVLSAKFWRNFRITKWNNSCNGICSPLGVVTYKFFKSLIYSLDWSKRITLFFCLQSIHPLSFKIRLNHTRFSSAIFKPSNNFMGRSRDRSFCGSLTVFNRSSGLHGSDSFFVSRYFSCNTRKILPGFYCRCQWIEMMVVGFFEISLFGICFSICFCLSPLFPAMRRQLWLRLWFP